MDSAITSGGAREMDGLPFALGPFIGRVDETAEIASLLATARLFTLTGTGGVGKTRLAGQLAASLRRSFRDGIRWVELGTLVDPALVSHVVAAQCGVATRDNLAGTAALVAALQERQLLLILDNCEHLLPSCARLIETLLGACPDLHILTTSREAIAIPGEVIWLVRPLRVPESDTPNSVEDALAHEAVALFVACATVALPAFQLTTKNAPSVVRICRRVEGLPLALELAAAHLRTLSPAELAERLDDAARLLTRGSRTAPPRQQSLRATLDWSYRLLLERERATFSRLAVFAGGFSLEAAEAVCAGPGVAEADVLDALSRLIEQSLVIAERWGEETRYRLLEPLRQYARERLAETGTAPQVEQRHRDWYATVAARATAELSGAEQRRWLDRVAIEHGNLRVALDWSLAHGDATGAGRIAAGIWQFWLLRGQLQEGHRWLERILAALPEPKPLRAQLLLVAGILARPDATLARRHFSDSLALWQALGDSNGIAQTLGSLGFLAQAQGDHPQALRYLEQSLPLVRDSTDSQALARILTGLALSALEAGEKERAEAFCAEGLALHRQTGDLRGVAAATANLGLIWRARGDEQRAAALWEESLTLRRDIGDVGGTAHVLTLLGNLALGQGASARAATLYHESLALHRQTGDRDSIAPLLDGLAATSSAHGDPTHAVRLAAAAEALRAATAMPVPPQDRATRDRMLAALRARLGAEGFARAWDEGQALPLEEAVAIATAQRPEGIAVPDLSVPAAVPSPSATPHAPLAANLTRREVEVLRLLAQGLTYVQLGEALAISPRTVDAHVRAIFGKLEVRSRGAATHIARQRRLI